MIFPIIILVETSTTAVGQEFGITKVEVGHEKRALRRNLPMEYGMILRFSYRFSYSNSIPSSTWKNGQTSPTLDMLSSKRALSDPWAI